VGADAFASDLNPIPVLLNKVVLEYIPKYGQRLADEVRKWGEWIKQQAEKELAELYPKAPDGATPIAYLWARTINCEGPGCGAEVPMIRSPYLRRSGNPMAVQITPVQGEKRVEFLIMVKENGKWVQERNRSHQIIKPRLEGTVKGGSATCPCCGYTTPKAQIRSQLMARRGGANDARLFCVVTKSSGTNGRLYRLPINEEESIAKAVAQSQRTVHSSDILLPDEEIPVERVWKNNPIRVHLYGMKSWLDIFTARQALAIATLGKYIRKLDQVMPSGERDLGLAVSGVLALAVDKEADYCSSLCGWVPSGEFVGHTFGRQAIPMIWDFVEVVPFSDSTGGFTGAIEWVANVLEREARSALPLGQVLQVSATTHPLPDESAWAFITDPPYYDAVPYSTLSNYFYVWLKRAVPSDLASLFAGHLSPNEEECVVDEAKDKTHKYYETSMTRALFEGRRILNQSGVGIVVFAHKSTSGWEALLQAIIDAGWTVTGSWPIDTEMGTRLRAHDSAALASSVHLVCRARHVGSNNQMGDWRDVLHELPMRIHEWMPRLAEEGIVGADAIFSCLGPALEIFSRYSRVEKANGTIVNLKEYLEHVWATVAKEALAMVFKGADATGFEADARLTAMWLWTLKAPDANGDIEGGAEDSEDESEIETRSAKGSGFTLEYDAARKIAQGLGAHLESLGHLVEIAGEEARLLPVSERTRYLFGKDEAEPERVKGRNRKSTQLDMFGELTESPDTEAVWKEKTVRRVSDTALDRVHQSMILFAAGRGEALKRFVVEDGVGRDGKFWRLAQALSALYPSSSDEKRWVDGVLARKKQFGF
jgi:adenine-specific DNA methylase